MPITECPFGEHREALTMLLEIKDAVSATGGDVRVLGARFESVAALTQQAFERLERLDRRVDDGLEMARQALVAAKAADERATAAIVASQEAKVELTKYRNWTAATAVAALGFVLVGIWEVAIKPYVNVSWK